jgi:hypothetical protein
MITREFLITRLNQLSQERETVMKPGANTPQEAYDKYQRYTGAMLFCQELLAMLPEAAAPPSDERNGDV